MRNPSCLLAEESFKEFLELECDRVLQSNYFFSLLVMEAAELDAPRRLGIIRRLRPVLREFDIFGTLEDTKIAIIMPYADRRNLLNIIERIRIMVQRNTSLMGEGLKAEEVKIWWSCFPRDALSPGPLADKIQTLGEAQSSGIP